MAADSRQAWGCAADSRQAWGSAESLWSSCLRRSRNVDQGTPVDLHRPELPQRLPGPQGVRGISQERLPCEDKRQPQTHWGQL